MTFRLLFSKYDMEAFISC